MKFFDILSRAWDPGQPRTPAAESPAERAAHNRSAKFNQDILEIVVGAVPVPEPQVLPTQESILKEIESLIDQRLSERMQLARGMNIHGVANDEFLYGWPGVSRYIELQHELRKEILLRAYSLHELPKEYVDPVFLNMVKTLAPPAKRPEEALADEIREALIETVNLAGGSPQAMRRLADCMSTIKHLQELCTALSDQNERLFTNLVLDPDSDKIQRHTAKPSE